WPGVPPFTPPVFCGLLVSGLLVSPAGFCSSFFFPAQAERARHRPTTRHKDARRKTGVISNSVKLKLAQIYIMPDKTNQLILHTCNLLKLLMTISEASVLHLVVDPDGPAVPENPQIDGLHRDDLHHPIRDAREIGQALAVRAKNDILLLKAQLLKEAPLLDL